MAIERAIAIERVRIAPQKTYELPNAIITPSIHIMAPIVNGKPKYGMHVTMMTARMENEGQLNETYSLCGGKNDIIVIDDVENLPADLASLDEEIKGVLQSLHQLTESLVSIRKNI